ncbi:hypothetical protein LSM04_009118 [Trypanosoma melophagium]|uniref:uncharacterized protein n=1 Tax=Trypanosoma melophagium TaxID=715481 RepID=UPI003519F769|nr:hypothetical protein LSM04_009118 [Trypanosoma melophagium]
MLFLWFLRLLLSTLLLSLPLSDCTEALPPGAASNAEPPSMDPPSGTYKGEVAITITRNQRHAYTYYTLDNTTPTERSEHFVDGAELVLNTPGIHIVKAVAYCENIMDSDVFTPSSVTVAVYNITPARIPPPVAIPATRGEIRRGRTTVKLSYHVNTTVTRDLRILYVMTYLPTLSTAGTRGAIPPVSPNLTWTVYNEQGIVIEKPGTHIVRARVFDTSVSPNEFSPRARFVYRLRPPLMYDVSTECCDVDNAQLQPQQPVLGYVFTVWVTNAITPISLFLSLSVKGCATQRHILDDTEVIHSRLREVAFQFITYTEAQPRVFVCVKEHNAKEFVAVPRQLSAAEMGNSNIDEYSFPVIAGVNGSNISAPLRPKGPRRKRKRKEEEEEEEEGKNLPSHAEWQSNTETGVAWFGFFLFSLFLFLFCLYMRGNSTLTYRGGERRRSRTSLHTNDVEELNSEDVDLVELMSR